MTEFPKRSDDSANVDVVAPNSPQVPRSVAETQLMLGAAMITVLEDVKQHGVPNTELLIGKLDTPPSERARRKITPDAYGLAESLEKAGEEADDPDQKALHSRLSGLAHAAGSVAMVDVEATVNGQPSDHTVNAASTMIDVMTDTQRIDTNTASALYLALGQRTNSRLSPSR